MESIVGHIWSSRRLSRTGWAILNRAREVIQTLPLFHPPPHSWRNASDRQRQRSLTINFLFALVTDIRLREERGSYDDDGELAERVVWALVLMQSERLPGSHQTCLMCGSQETGSDVQCTQSSPRVSMERRLVSGCGFWALNELSVFPNLRDVDHPNPLCGLHDLLFDLALDAVLGYIDRPAHTLHSLGPPPFPRRTLDEPSS